MSGPPDAVTLTLFRDKQAKTKQTVRWSMGELASAITTTTADDKSALPWLKLARFGNARSPQGSLRHDANVAAVSGVECDYDGGELAVWYAVELLERRGILSVLYTSPSHTEDKPRWRALCPLSQEMEPHRRRHMAGRLNGLFRGAFARESFTLSQAFYFGSVRQNPSHQVHLIEGHPIDQDDDLDAVWVGPAETSTGDPGNAEGAAIADAELIRQVYTGETFHFALCALAARYIGRGMSAESVAEVAYGVMLAHPPESRGEKWRERFGEIGALVASAARKYQPAAEQRRALASLAGKLIRSGKSEAEVLAEIDAAAEAAGVANEVARRILDWVVQQENARLSGGRRHG